MRRLALVVVGSRLAAAALYPAAARACSVRGPSPYMVDPSMQATDQVPPTLPPLSVASLQRGKAQEGCSSNSCEGVGTLAIAGAATDDITPDYGIGYRFSLVAGALPPYFSILLDQPSQATVSEGKLWLNWDDGATDDQETIDFTLRVIAIDKAGNESAPQTVRVTDDPGGACAIAPARAPARGLAWVAVAVLCLASRWRRRRRTP